MNGKSLPSRRIRLTALALTSAAALTAAVTTCSSPAATTAEHTSRPAWPGELTALVQRDVDEGAPGVVVRVDDGRGPAVEIARQAPWSRRDHRLSAGDRFKMGSNTKTMVATVILQLAAAHRLALSDPVDTWLPGLVPDGRAITLRMLLNHTSGLFNYTNDSDALKAFTGQDARPWTPQELITAAVRHAPLFSPGTRYSYSNTNYIALGLVAEKAGGHSLGDLIRRRITEPLHLKSTYLDTGTSRPGAPRLAHGYEPDADRLAPLLPPGTPAGTAFAGPARPGGNVDTTEIGLSSEWAAGAMVSTAAEWARFDAALLSGRLLPATELREMRTTVPEEPTIKNRYGLGLERIVTPCGTVWGHVGQVPGYSSEDYTDATGRRTVSVFASTVFGLARPATGAADRAVVDAAVCAMLDQPVPGKSESGPRT